MKEKEATQQKDGLVPGRKSPCDVTCRLGDQTYTGTSIHFSERGILVMCKTPAPLNSKVKLVLQFPGLRNQLEANGEVVWSNIHGAGDSLSPKGMGVKFLNLERDMERLLAELAGHYECAGSVYACYYT
ncbi:MAG: PilZ domain-containing protein [Syntrophobacteraceae bacterium]